MKTCKSPVRKQENIKKCNHCGGPLRTTGSMVRCLMCGRDSEHSCERCATSQAANSDNQLRQTA